MINQKEVYLLLRQIPQGKVTTYKEIAIALNSTGYRAIGKIIGKNDDIPKTPCHRVVRSNGEIGEYTKGQKQKIMLLQKEGIAIKNSQILDFNQKLHKF